MMKKLLLIGVIALFGVMNAQVKFGIKGGYSLTTLHSKNAVNESKSTAEKSTYYVGALVEYKFKNKFSVQGEVLYSPLGGINETKTTTGEYYFESREDTDLEMILIPIGVKYYATQGLTFGTGLNFGIITSANYSFGGSLTIGGVPSMGDAYSQDIKDRITSLNIAPYIGAEYTLIKGLFVDARYNFGLNNLAKNDDDGNYKVKNSFLQIGVGYKF